MLCCIFPDHVAALRLSRYRSKPIVGQWSRSEAGFILAIAECKVHEERPEPGQASAATAQQQRCALMAVCHLLCAQRGVCG